MSYELTEKKLTTANKKLLKDLHNSLGIDKTVLSNAQLLQKISQALFSKPFEEVQKTIFKDVTAIESSIPRILLLEYGSETILVVDGVFESATYSGTSIQRKDSELHSEAHLLASRINTIVRKVSLPSVLSDDWEYNDVVNLAKKMGYFKYEKTFFDIVEESNVKIFIDGEHTPFSLDGDWESECDDDGRIDDVIVWSPEIGQPKDFSFREYYFTFNDICNAELHDDGSWILVDGSTKEKYLINFSYIK